MKNIVSYITVFFLALTLLVFLADVALAQSGGQIKNETVGDEKPAYVKGITSARARSLIVGAVGLVSVVISWCARVRSTAHTNTSRTWAISALLLGLLTVILSIVHLTGNTGGFGTGGGKAGAIVALLLGITGATLSALTLRNTRK